MPSLATEIRSLEVRIRSPSFGGFPSSPGAHAAAAAESSCQRGSQGLNHLMAMLF